MNNKAMKSITSKCRTCMSSIVNKTHRNQCIYQLPPQSKDQLSIMELLQFVAPQIKIKIKDDLPKIICTSCVEKLQNTYKFLQMYKRVTEIYKKILQGDNYKADKCRNKEVQLELSEQSDNDDTKESPSIHVEMVENILCSGDDSLTSEEENLDKHSYNVEEDFENSAIISKEIPLDKTDGVSATKHVADETPPQRGRPPKNTKAKRTYKCQFCAKLFKDGNGYKNHLRTHTGEQPFLCIECGRTFKAASSLNTHMKRHRGEKLIQCPDCPKQFVCRSGLYAHRVVHTKVRPHICDLCGAAFPQRYELKKHNLYHNGIKNYKCDYCDKCFVTGEKKRRHMRTHTGEKPYCCKYCPRAFAQSNDCVKHLRSHLGDNVYHCELCPSRFPMARDLRAHFATHKDDDEETRAKNLQAKLEAEKLLSIKYKI